LREVLKKQAKPAAAVVTDNGDAMASLAKEIAGFVDSVDADDA